MCDKNAQLISLKQCFEIALLQNTFWTAQFSKPTERLSNIFTDRVRSTRGGNIFSLSVCPHPGWGVPTFRMVGGGVPTQVWMVGGGYLPRSGWEGYLLSGLDGGGLPTFPGLDRGGGYLPSQVGGVPR